MEVSRSPEPAGNLRRSAGRAPEEGWKTSPLARPPVVGLELAGTIPEPNQNQPNCMQNTFVQHVLFDLYVKYMFPKQFILFLCKKHVSDMVDFIYMSDVNN